MCDRKERWTEHERENETMMNKVEEKATCSCDGLLTDSALEETLGTIFYQVFDTLDNSTVSTSNKLTSHTYTHVGRKTPNLNVLTLTTRRLSLISKGGELYLD